MGRETLLTEQVKQKIVQAISAGNYFETACKYAGIGIATGYEWLARGEGRSRNRPCSAVYAEFAEAIRQAEGQCEVHAVARVQQAIPENPRLGLDFLARRFPDRWGNRDKLDIGGSGKEIVFRVIYGDPQTPRSGDSPASTACETGSISPVEST